MDKANLKLKKYSFWEKNTWFKNVDFTIIGSGIVGLNCALSLRKKYPKAKIIILEKGNLPQGASTKNAGFACFGSVSEILKDLQHHSEDEVYDLIEKRWRGLQRLRNLLGDENIDFQQNGGFEFFFEDKKELQGKCLNSVEIINQMIQPIFNKPVFRLVKNSFDFEKILEEGIFNRFEGQIDTGLMMMSLLQKVYKNEIFIINSSPVLAFQELEDSVELQLNQVSFRTQKLFIATNGFSQQLGLENVRPARAQVLITKPIHNLKIKGTFHLEEGFYYFRNIHNRILLGGGRNLDLQTEETTEFGITETIQSKLEYILAQVILPYQAIEIDMKWSGIMGVGDKKKPIVRQISNHIVCGIRMGGMGVAIGSLVGEEMAQLLE